MDDNRIIDLYRARSEAAIAETANKYGRYCGSIAFHILRNREDSEECVNDTYMRAWNAIPPQKPDRLSVFLGRITRNLALDRWKYRGAKKRGPGQVTVALEELQECIPAGDSVEQAVDDLMLTEALNRFLTSLQAESRIIFMQRYWYLRSVKEIAENFRFTESKVKMSLLRSRNSLKTFLEKEGIM